MAHEVDLDYFKSLQRYATLDRPNTRNISSFCKIKSGKTAKTRPLSAKRVSPARSKRASKGLEGILSREDKTEENIQLKTQLSTLKSELLKLRVKLKSSEGDTRRDELSSERQMTVLALKQQNKELSRKLQAKEKDFEDLKRSVKATNFQELDVQVKIYNDECTRLRRLLTESLQQLAEGVEMGDMAEKYLTLSIQYRDLKKEHDELQPGRKIGKGEDLAEKLKRTLIEVQEENTRVHRDNQRLINEMQTLKQTLKCPNCETAQLFNETIDRQTRTVDEVIAEIWLVLHQKNIDLKSAWNIIDSDRFDILKSAAFSEGLKQLNVHLSSMELTKLMLEFNPIQGNKVSFAQFEAALNKRKPEKEESNIDIDEVFTHLRMRLQVRRWEYDQMAVLIVPERRDYFPEEVAATLEKEPFELAKDQSQGLVNFLFENNPCMKSAILMRKFSGKISPWDVLNEDEEQDLDDVIRQALSYHSEQFVRLCTEKDRKNSGLITYGDLEEVLRSLNVEFPHEVLEYIKLLCYTHNFELDSVPYLHLASAYVDDAQLS